MSHRSDATADLLEELPDGDALDWTAVRSLLTANAETTRALEAYFVRAQYRDDDSSDLSPAKEHIREAIDRHESIVENLELALAAADERERLDE
ncbi:hypothetical protein [Halopelagius longus]|uniref:DUF8103 domain-containing protein n=1 Tax=Halopelagius longus TaxID=1236180 RepID=A0A1H0Y1X3_9EURY|nr:hypothetical protein [Halopelagius longus]RDI72233.1 hypothetical protein DWB78_11210 [Halopelagius longus]SDQ09167.1 hypothetical protein SAMN05216278_0350 [Halopelagius longus]